MKSIADSKCHHPKRLDGFDYRTPYFYMVTLGVCSGFREKLSEITQLGFRYTPLTTECVKVIKQLHLVFPEIAEVTTFTVMPDHLHLLIRIKSERSEVDLSAIVEGLIRRMRDVGVLLDPEYHDRIVLRRGELERLTKYIRSNPEMARVRKCAAAKGLFNRVRKVLFADAVWYAYGNVELLKLPDMELFNGFKTAFPGEDERHDMLARARRIDMAGVGVGTFCGRLERECEEVILKAGGNLIVLSPGGFIPAGNGSGYNTPQGEPTRWHPTDRYEKFCADGRVLFLSLWEGTPCRLPDKKYFARCDIMRETLEHSALFSD